MAVKINVCKKGKAALLIAMGNKHKDVATQIGVTPQTLCNWLKDDEFIVRINKHKDDILCRLRNKHLQLAEKAVKSTMDLLDSENDKVKLEACKYVLQSVGLHENSREELIGPTSEEELNQENRFQRSLQSMLNLVPNVFG